MSFMAQRSTMPPRPQSLYFAYGSNLQLKQMAKRCPESRYQGRARLHKYRWQINDRGFANVVPDSRSGAVVEGLCYLLSAEDEARLDRSEGVPTAYQKMLIDVEFVPAASKLLGRKVTEILDHNLMGRINSPPHGQSRRPQNEDGAVEPPNRAGGALRFLQIAASMVNSVTGPPRRDTIDVEYEAPRTGRTEVVQPSGVARRRGRSVPDRAYYQSERRPPRQVAQRTDGETTQVLVYLSQMHVQDGLPWDEYIERMNWGVIDAIDLGIPKQYFERFVAPYLRAATGLNSNGERRSRGVRERKTTRGRYTSKIKQERRTNDQEISSDHQMDQTTLHGDSIDWDREYDRPDSFY